MGMDDGRIGGFVPPQIKKPDIDNRNQLEQCDLTDLIRKETIPQSAKKIQEYTKSNPSFPASVQKIKKNQSLLLKIGHIFQNIIRAK